MKNLRQNLEVRATIPVKLGKKSTWEVLFPRRLWEGEVVVYLEEKVVFHEVLG